MTTNRKNKRNIGFTLVEVMLAVVIISIICIGSSAYAWHTMKRIQESEKQLTALNYAEHIAELLLQTESGFMPPLVLDATKYLTLNSTNDWESSSSATSWDITLDSEAYNCVLTATQRFSNTASFVEAEISVTPPDGRAVTLSTLKDL
jgi:prepilin-type N-terminal cleavage/methylation domain-containing protein